VRALPAVAISEERLDPTEIQPYAGIRVTLATYALLFEIRHCPFEDRAVEYADMAAYDDLVSRDELALLVARSSGWDGIGRGRRVVDLMEENAWSPAEVSMRGIWSSEAGRRRPAANQPVFDLGGRHVATPDLLDVAAGVAGEYESDLHLERNQRRRDVQREDRYRSVGLEPVIMVTGDLADPWRFVGRLHAAYARAARTPVADRRWTVEQPPWWTPTQTVALRRALTAEKRARWLRHRAAS
jgi:hypothetical protein